jgi:hypothetical protein
MGKRRSFAKTGSGRTRSDLSKQSGVFSFLLLQVMTTMGMSQTQEECFVILCVMYVILRVMAYMMLVQVTRGKKGAQ